MVRLLIRRILLGIVVTWVVSMMIFAATELLPGDVCHAVLGQGATEKSLENCRERLQLNEPMHTRYLEWLGRLVTGDSSLPGVSAPAAKSSTVEIRMMPLSATSLYVGVVCVDT